jgi:glycosyltransferase involved in cell wall biosynthesis
LLKVLYISPNGYLGGAESFVLTAVEGHQNNNFIDASILFFSEGEAVEMARNKKLKYEVLNSSFRLKNPFKLFMALLKIRKIIKHQLPDVLHSTMPYSHIVISLASLGLKIKKVWFQHGPVGGLLDQIANFFPVDMIWYNSQFLLQEHNKTIPHCRIKKSENIIRLSSRVQPIEREIFQGTELVLGAAGRICSWKGFHNVLIALGELKKEKGVLPLKFMIAGSAKSLHDKEYEKYLKEMAKSLNLNSEVTFSGHVASMENFYKELDIFIHSSNIPEPFGLVALEAMSNGCMVIGSNTGGISDFLNNKTGQIFNSSEKSAIEELKVILELLIKNFNEKNMDHFKILAKNGRKNVLENYSVVGMTSQIEKLYLELLVKIE